MPSASKPVLAAASACGLLATASTALSAFTAAPSSASPSSSAQLRGTNAFETIGEAASADSPLPFTACASATALVAAAGLSAKNRRSTKKSSCRASKVACRAVAVGTEVVWNGKEGVVRYVGSTKFAAGEWVGVELKSPGGMHNGTVMGVSYFDCPEGCGVFAQPDQLLGGAAPAPAAPAPAAAPAAATAASAAPAAALAVGATVSWNGKQGTVRYVGSTKFAAGEWAGLELAEGGMHDGTVMGTKYFECPAGCGVFVPAAQLAGAAAAPAAPAAPSPAVPAAAAAPAAASGSISVGAKVAWNGKEGTVRFVGSTKFAAGEWVGVELDGDGGMHDGSVMGVSYFACAPGRGIFAPESALSLLVAA